MKQILRLQTLAFGGMAALYLAGYTVIGLTGGIRAIWALAASAVICVAISGLSFIDVRKLALPEEPEGASED